jgi:hypothetical protein
MQLASVSLARHYGLVQIEDLNLGGEVYLPEVGAALVQRYGFLKYPIKPEEFDEGKGIEFLSGRLGKRVIDKLMILDSGLYLDTQINTAASEELWYELMDWAVDTFGVTFKREMVKRRAYVSTITFFSDAPMLKLNSVFEEIGAVVNSEVEINFGRKLEYYPAAMSITYDQLLTKFGTAAFTVQRREGVPFEEGKYFSTAPVKTEIHLDLLERWEKTVSR